MGDPRIYQESPDRLDDLVCKVSKMLFKNKKRILSSCELTCSQFDMLSAIYQHSIQKREIIQIDLSNTTGIDPMTTSTILRNLQRKGLIIRTRGIINTRTVIVELTSRGYEQYKKAFMKIKSRNDMIYQSINRELLSSQLNDLLSRLTRII